MATKPKPKPVNQEQIIAGLNQLRQEQRFIASKISELESDLSAHNVVLETLKELKDQDRKCYRMIGGVLVQRTVAEVQISLQSNKDMLTQTVEKYKEKIIEKGVEINNYMEQYSIRPVIDGPKGPGDISKVEDKKPENSSVLISKD